jgi:hypothetical protein
VKLITDLLEDDGVMKVAEILPIDRKSHFEYTLESSGLKIQKQTDITANVIKALLLQKGHHSLKEQLIELIDGEKSQLIHQLTNGKNGFYVYTLTNKELTKN